MKKPSRTPASASSNGMFHPLDVLYKRAGIAEPAGTAVAPDEIPAPYSDLLVHENDMTLTLERHFGGRVVLRVLSTCSKRPWYFRRVLLVQEYSGRPVAMGAIKIKFDACPPRIRAQILRGEVPLGKLLRAGGVDYRSRPRVFFEVAPNAEMMGMFWMREPRTLYGRQTAMTVGGTTIGHVVEILPLV